MLKTKDLANVTFDAFSSWRNILAYIVYAVRLSYHSTLQAIPGKLFFGRDILLDNNFQLNYKETWLIKQKVSYYNNKRENAKQVQYDYEVVHYAYILKGRNYLKLEEDKLVTLRITQVHNNGSVGIQRGIVNE